MQIKAAEGDTKVFKEQVIDRIKDYHNKKGYELVENEEEADKSVIISICNNSPWVSIYDEEGTHDLTMLIELGEELTKQQGTTCFSVLILDSDYIVLGYYKEGKLLEQMSNLSLLIDLETEKPEIWAELTPNRSFEEIKKAWKYNVFSTKNFLKDFSKLINIPPSRLLRDYYTLHKEDSCINTLLHFVDKEKKEREAITKSVSLNMLIREGSTKIKPFHSHKMKWLMTNFGESSQGLEILVSGKAIDKLYLVPSRAKISYYKEGENKKEYISEFMRTSQKHKGKVFYISLPDLFIPKGKKPIPSIKPQKNQQNQDFLYSIAIQIEIEFLGLNEGKDNVNVLIIPMKNRKDGHYCESIEVSVD